MVEVVLVVVLGVGAEIIWIFSLCFLSVFQLSACMRSCSNIVVFHLKVMEVRILIEMIYAANQCLP